MRQAVDEASVTYAITAPGRTVVPIVGSDAVFPVGRVFCVGRNYAEHAIEMGHDPNREPPFFFMKPAGAVVPSGSVSLTVASAAASGPALVTVMV